VKTPQTRGNPLKHNLGSKSAEASSGQQFQKNVLLGLIQGMRHLQPVWLISLICVKSP